MKKLRAIAIFLSLIGITCVACLYFMKPQELIYDLLVESEVSIFKGEEYKVLTKLTDQNGTLYDGEYIYESSNTNLVKVDEYGNISINENSSILNYEDVYISVREVKSNVVKKVKINIIFDLKDVFSFTSLDDPNAMVQTMLIGTTYMFEVSTLPRDFSVEDYFSINVFDLLGNKKDIFKIDFNKNIVSLTPEGIGEGEFEVKIVNNIYDLDFNTSVKFRIDYYVNSLTNDILNSTGKTLLSKDELKNINKLVVSSKKLKIDENFIKTFDLANIQTIIFLNEELCELEYIDDIVVKTNLQNIIYRVNSNKFLEYLSYENWDFLKYNLIPYDSELMDYNDKYIVYHYSDNSNSDNVYDNNLVSYKKINNSSLDMFTNYEGYTQVAWKDKNNNIIENLDKVNGGIHLFAEWKANEYSITLYGNGLIENQEIKVQYNSKFDLPTYTSINGWNFVSWYTDSSFENEYNKDEYYTETDDLTLYAKWTTKITLDYDGNSQNGNEELVISDVLYGANVTLPILDTTRNWEFDGWYTEQSGKGTKVENGTYVSKGNARLYAKWTYDLKLEYHKEEFEIEGLEDSIKLINGLSLDEISCTLPNNYKVDDNWLLESWYTQENYQGKILTNNEIIKIDNFVNYETGEKIVETIYALYTSNAYFMDGDELIHTIKINYNEEVNPHVEEYDSKATKEGYKFLTWNCTDNEGITLLYMWIYQGPGKEAIPDRSWKIKCTKVYGNMIFTAEYRANKYNVIFDLQGGEIEDYRQSNLSVQYDSSFNYPSNPSKKGYTLSGWKLVSVNGETRNEILSLEKLINITSVNNGIVRFEAVWEANTYKFVLNGNGIVSNREVNLVYNQEMELEDLGTFGIWTFAGWYVDSEYNQEVSDVCNYVYEEGKDYIELYSKWITSITFNYDIQTKDSLVINDVIYGKGVEISGLLDSVEGWTINGWYSQPSGLGEQILFNGNTKEILNYNYNFNTVYPKLECETIIKFDHLDLSKNGYWEETVTLTKGLTFNEDILPDILCFEDETFQQSWKLCKWTSDINGNNIIDSTLVINEIIPFVYPHFESQIKLFADIDEGIEEEIKIILGSKIKLFTKEILNQFDSDYRRAFYAWKYDDITITEVNFESKAYNIVTKDMANRVYTALYKDGMYTIKYVYTKDNGQNVSVSKKYSLVDEQFKTLEAVSKEGYTFIQWQCNETVFDANSNYDTFASKIGEVIVMNAIWEENSYIINYVVSDSIEEISGQDLKYTELANLKSIDNAKEGFIFVGWSKTEDRTNVDFKALEEINKLSSVNNDIVNLYDCYVPITYYINLYDQKDNLIERIEKLYTDEEFVISEIERIGYTLISWEDEEGKELIIGEKVNKLINDQEEINIYGTWNENEYTINVYDDYNLVTSTKLTYSQVINTKDLLNEEYSKLGYTFNSLVDEEEKEYLLNQSISSLKELNNDQINLYINWKPIEFSVYFEDFNDEITLIYAINYNQKFGEINDQLGLPKEEEVYKENFEFKGWFFDKEYNISITKDTLVSDIINAENIEEIINNNCRIKLYGKYTSQLTLNKANGLEDETIEIIYGEEIKLPLYDTTNSWQFNGWYLNTNYYDYDRIGSYENDEIRYLIDDQSGNLNLYAKWTSNINLYTFKDKKVAALSKNNFKLIYGWNIGDIFEYNNSKTNPLNFEEEKGWTISFVDDVNNVQHRYFEDSTITCVSDLYVNYQCNVTFNKTTKSSNVSDNVILNLNWLCFDSELNVNKINLYDLCLDSIESEIGYTAINWSYISNANVTKNISLASSELSYENGLANSSIQMIFNANKYTIYFDPGKDGTTYAISLEVTYDETYNSLPRADKYGYDNFSSLKSPQWIVNGDIIKNDSIVKITSDTIVEPAYTAKKFYISFSAYPGSMSTSLMYYQFDNSYTMPVPTRTNYVFRYWTYNGIPVTDNNGNGLGNLRFTDVGVTVEAVYTLSYTKIDYSVDNGRRDKQITDEDGVYDLVNPKFDVAALKALGYKGITIQIDFDCQEVKDGYQDLWICCNSTRLDHEEFEHSPDKKSNQWLTLKSKTFYISFNSISAIGSQGAFYVEWGANGEGEDTWNLGHTIFKIGVYK